jgi:hypothetical protein
MLSALKRLGVRERKDHAMQAIHITCRYDCLLSLAESLEAHLAGLEGVMLLEYGFSQKRIDGYVVLQWDEEEVDEAFLQKLEAEETIFDYCVYSVSDLEDVPLWGRTRSFDSSPI